MPNEMDCSLARQKLSEAQDGALAKEENETLEAHLKGCEECRGYRADLDRLGEHLRALAEADLDVPDTEAFVAKLQEAIGDEEPGSLDPEEESAEEEAADSLHDIQKLAAAMAAQPERGESAADLFGISGKVDVEEPEAVPVVVPPPVLMPTSGRPRWAVPALIVAGILILGASLVGAVLYFLHAPKEGTQAHRETTLAQADQIGPAPGSETKPTTMETQPAPRVAPRPRPRPSEPANPLPDLLGRPSNSPSGPSKTSRPGAPRRRRRRPRRSAASPAAPRPRARQAAVPDFSAAARSDKPAARAPRAHGSGDPLSALLDTRKPGAARPRAAAPSLPPKLTTADIKAVMRRVTSAVRKCHERYKKEKKGLLKVRVTVAGSTGRVTAVSVSGVFKGTQTARCVVKAIRRQRFKKFAQPLQRFTYPYILR